jgi:molybdopterin molybdotransferase
MISVEQARDILHSQKTPQTIVRVPLPKAMGLVLAADIFSPIDVPVFDNSAMDGFAIAFAGEALSFEILGTVQAGDPPVFSLLPGQSVRIFTGAPIPNGTQAIVQQEWTQIEANRLVCRELPVPGMHIRYQGSQCFKGNLLLRKGQKLTYGHAGLLASVGLDSVSVLAPPRTGIIVTGNELQEPGMPLLPGQIYNSNQVMIYTALARLGLIPDFSTSVPDNPDLIIQTVAKALEVSQVLVVSGGISVGEFDYVQHALQANGVEMLFYKVLQKPGKPLWVGRKGSQWVFALPGNPAAVLTCFRLYVQPFLLSWMGQPSSFEADFHLQVSSPVVKKGDLTHFRKAIREGANQIRLLDGQDSFNLMPFSEGDALVELDARRSHWPEGSQLPVFLL